MAHPVIARARAAPATVPLGARLRAARILLGRPLYAPGAVRGGRAAAPLDPPPQDGDGAFRVEAGIALYHEVDGAGRAAVVVHGGPGIPGDGPWPGLAGVDGFAFHRYDQRGCGRSTRPFAPLRGASWLANVAALDGTLGLAAQVADLERVRRLLGEDRLVVVAHSFGALVASLWAAEFPEHVAALVLESPPDLLRVPAATGGLFELVASRLAPPGRDAFRAWLGRYLDFRRLFARTEAELAALHAGFAPFWAAALRAGGLDRGASLDPPPAERVGGFLPQALYLGMGRAHDWRPALRAVRAPVLVLHGERDLQPLEATRSFAAAFAGAAVRVVPGAAHFAHLEAPAAFRREVGAFLAAIR